MNLQTYIQYVTNVLYMYIKRYIGVCVYVVGAHRVSLYMGSN